MEKLLYPPHPVRCIIPGFSNSGNSVFLTNLILKFINDFEKIYIFSPSIHQDSYQKQIKCFSNYTPINIILSILNEEDIDIKIEQESINKDFEKFDETYEFLGNICFDRRTKIPSKI